MTCKTSQDIFATGPGGNFSNAHNPPFWPLYTRSLTGLHKHKMNGENMNKHLAIAVSVLDLIDADEHNGRVFIEVPVSAAVYDQLRFRATDNNSSVSDEAARVLSSVVVD